MIVLYTGTPGSGKSLAMARKIHFILTIKRGSVISTVDIDIDYISYGGEKRIGKFFHRPIFELSPDFFYEYAYENHKKGKEGQTAVFIDECQLIFNSRDFASRDRRSWLEFFTHHRHFGYNFYLVTQHDRMLDRQIRALVEIEYKHRKLNNVLWFLPFKLFVQVELWYGGPRSPKLRSEYFVLRRKFARLYDTHAMWDELEVRILGKEKGGASASASSSPILAQSLSEFDELSAARMRVAVALRACLEVSLSKMSLFERETHFIFFEAVERPLPLDFLEDEPVEDSEDSCDDGSLVFYLDDGSCIFVTGPNASLYGRLWYLLWRVKKRVLSFLSPAKNGTGSGSL